MRTRWDKNYLEQLLNVIHANVKKCKWNVGWGVPYGSFTISCTKEILEIAGIKFKDDDDIIFAAHHIASRMEEKSNG